MINCCIIGFIAEGRARPYPRRGDGGGGAVLSERQYDNTIAGGGVADWFPAKPSRMTSL